MERIPVIAIADFEWEGALRAKGERFDVRPIEAAALTYQRRARFVTDSEDVTEPPLPAPPPPEPVAVAETKALTTRSRRKPRKKRRDIVTPQHTKALT